MRTCFLFSYCKEQYNRECWWIFSQTNYSVSGSDCMIQWLQLNWFSCHHVSHYMKSFYVSTFDSSVTELWQHELEYTWATQVEVHANPAYLYLDIQAERDIELLLISPSSIMVILLCNLAPWGGLWMKRMVTKTSVIYALLRHLAAFYLR